MSLADQGALRLHPLLKERVWGGRRLADFGFALPPGTIGEAWLLADLPNSIPEGRSTIVGGPWHGRALRDLLVARRTELLGNLRPTDEGGFPLLVKLLDARENLSIQVHPTPAYAAVHRGAAVKNEAWLVLEAEPGAQIFTGLHAIPLGEFRDLAARGRLVDALVGVPARPGECHLLRSGTCHALGGGIVVAEIQTPSDTTFRVDDWGRSGRELHLEAAIECIYGPNADGGAMPRVPAAEPIRPLDLPAVRHGPVSTRTLMHTPDFTLDRLDADDDAAVDVDVAIVTDGRPTILLGLADGVSVVGGAAGEGPLPRGQLALIPACAADLTLRLAAGASVLRVDPTPPLRM